MNVRYNTVVGERGLKMSGGGEHRDIIFLRMNLILANASNSSPHVTEKQRGKLT